jgi:hypothetical protein
MALSEYIQSTFLQERKSIGAEVNWGVRFLVPEDVRILQTLYIVPVFVLSTSWTYLLISM